jgi:hypothetical protein
VKFEEAHQCFFTRFFTSGEEALHHPFSSQEAMFTRRRIPEIQRAADSL